MDSNAHPQQAETVAPAKTTGGYYTVNLDINGQRLPYVVFAHSLFEAARRVKFETGCPVNAHEFQGPYPKYI